MLKALHGTTYVFDYILEVSRIVHEEGLMSISFGEVHRIIKKFAIGVQIAREIEAGKKWRDYRKKAQEPGFMLEAADKTVAAMVLWGFLERPKGSAREKGRKEDRRYHVSSALQTIGEELSSDRHRKARLIISDRAFLVERETAFSPKLLLKIRDSSAISEMSSEYDLPTRGVLQWSASLVRSRLGISQVDFKMVTSWFQDLGFLNVFNPRIMDQKQPKEVYLTVWIATLKELESGYAKISHGETTESSCVEIDYLRLLETIKAIRLEHGLVVPQIGRQFVISKSETVLANLDDPFASDLIIIADSKKSRRFMRAKMKNIDNAYFLYPKQVSTREFVNVFQKKYSFLRVKWKTPYVWISPLRALCCRTLMISDDSFDDMLTRIYKQKPEAMEFSKAATGIFRKRVRIFEKPFKLYGNPFRMIRLVERL